MSIHNGDLERLVRENEALRREVSALQFEAARFKTTLYSVGDAVITTDVAGAIVQMNPVAEALTGWSEAEAKGHPIAEVIRIVNEETLSEVESPVARVLRGGVVVGLANHTLLIAKDGSKRPIADSGAPIRDEAGIVTGVVLVFRDQTRERKAQKALLESEEKHRTLFENAEVGMYRSRLDGSGILALNQRLADLFGYTKAEMMASPATMRWADARARESMVRLVREHGELRDHEIDIVTKGGQVRTVLASIKLFPEAGYLEGTAIDVTERKRIEQRSNHLNLVLKAIRNVNQLIVHEDDPQRLIERACRNLTETMGYFNAWIALLDEHGRAATATACSGLDGQFAAMRQHLERGDLSGCARRAMAQDATVVVNDPIVECKDCPLARAYAGRAGLTRRLAFEGRIYGLLAVSVPAIYAGDDEEQDLFAEVADDLGFALYRIELQEQRRKAEAERQAAIEERNEGSRLVSESNRLLLELASATAERDVRQDIAQHLRRITDATAAFFNEYDPQKRSLVARGMDLESGLLAKAVELLGRRIEEVESPVDDAAYQTILASVVGRRKTLTEMTFGAVPPAVGAVVQRLLGAERFIGLAHIVDGRLFGTSTLALRRDQPDPPQEWLESIAHTIAVFLRRRKAEEELRHSRSELESATRLTHVGHWYWNIKTNEMRWTEEVYRLFGATNESEVLKLDDWAARVHPDDWSELERKVKTAIADKTLYRHEYRIIQPDGSVRSCAALGQPVLDGSGDVVAFQGAIQDITERKRAEEALRDNQRQLQLITDNVRDTVWLMDLGMKTTWISPSVVRTRGFTLEELADMPMERHLAPDSLRHMMQLAAIHLTPEKLADPKAEIVVQGDFEFYRKDGTTFWADSVVSLLRNANGVPTGFVGVGRDITERKRAEAVRQQLEEQLRTAQKMEAIGSLAGGVAHDFNNILSVIRSYTAFVQETVPRGSPLHHDLLEIEKAGERATALTRQLLAFSRKQILQPVALDLNQVAAGVEKMLRRIVGEDIDFVQVLAPDLGVVRADPGQLEQVLMNLVVNARDAMPEGGKLTIETANVEIDEEYAARHVDVTPGSYVQLVVTDTGCGMDEQTKARLFEPFFTTKEKGKGTGLGLSTVYGIVKQSGGNIWVYSEPGQGTTFKIYLPRELGAAATVTQAPEVVARPTGTETVLVVEDEEALRKVAKRSLTAAGFTVLTAADGVEALETAARHAGEIHLLLTDVVMPKMSGRALAVELTKTRPAIQVLYMSGYTDNAIVHHGVLDPGTQFLPKPFSGNDLTRKVREVLDQAVAADGRRPAGEKKP